MAFLYSIDLRDFEAGRFVATRYPKTCAVSGDYVLIARSERAARARIHDAAYNEWAEPETRAWDDYTVTFCDSMAFIRQKEQRADVELERALARLGGPDAARAALARAQEEAHRIHAAYQAAAARVREIQTALDARKDGV